MEVRKKRSIKTDKKDIMLRQVSDHLVQLINRVRDDVEYILFLRTNTKIQEVSTNFYIKQIDRFSRDVVITVGHILDRDDRASSLYKLVKNIENKNKRVEYQKKLNDLHEHAALFTELRHKVIAHYETEYNSSLSEYYTTQPFNSLFLLDPCVTIELLDKADKLFGELFEELSIEGIGVVSFNGSNDFEKIFNENALGVADSVEQDIEFKHKCTVKKCLLKNYNKK